MATLSTHALNGADGKHAGGIGVSLNCVHSDGTRETLFDATTDSGGRLSRNIEPLSIDTSATYELVFSTRAYWSSRDHDSQPLVADQIAIRLVMRDPNARYHVPLILSPHSWSLWVSQPETDC